MDLLLRAQAEAPAAPSSQSRGVVWTRLAVAMTSQKQAQDGETPQGRGEGAGPLSPLGLPRTPLLSPPLGHCQTGGPQELRCVPSSLGTRAYQPSDQMTRAQPSPPGATHTSSSFYHRCFCPDAQRFPTGSGSRHPDLGTRGRSYDTCHEILIQDAPLISECPSPFPK